MKRNQLFYEEQEVWLQILNQNKREGWSVSIVINDVTLQSSDEESITLQINMKRQGQNISNHIIPCYELLNQNLWNGKVFGNGGCFEKTHHHR